MNSTQPSFIKYWIISPKSLVQLLLVLFCSNVWGQNIKEGFLNISDLHLSEQNIELSGEMRFYWGELLDYEQIKSGQWSSQIINSGNSWNNQPEGIQSHPNIGCGTCTFQLIIPEELVGERLIMRPKHFISYASKISVNGEICAQNGRVGSSKDDVNYKPGRATETVSFAPSSDTLSVVIQVANFHHFRGGIFKGIDIGTEQNMRKARERAISLDLFIIVSLLIMLLYHLILFAVNPKEYTSLFFAFVCLPFSLDLSMQGPMSFFLFFPEANYHFYIIMHLVVPYFIPATFFLFIGLNLS